MKTKDFFYTSEPHNELEQSRVSFALKIIISVTFVLLSILIIIRLFLHRSIGTSDYLLWAMNGAIILIAILSIRNKVRLAGFLFIIMTWIPLTLLAWTNDGVKDIAIVGYIVCILFAMNITLYWQAHTIFLLSLISIWGLVYAEYNQFVVPTTESSFQYSIDYTVILGLVMVLLVINRRSQLFYYKNLQKELNEKISAVRSLKESESLIRSISDNFSSGMIFQVIRRSDGTKRFTYLSDSVKKMHGISPEEGISDASLIFGRVQKDDIGFLLAAEDESARSLSVLNQEVRIHDPSGKVRWSSLVSTPKKLEDGSVCFDGIEFIITERKNAEEALKAALDRTKREQSVVATIGSSREPESAGLQDLMNHITEQAAKAIDVERVGVWLFSDKQDELICEDLFEKSRDHHSSGMVLQKKEYNNEFEAIKNVKYIDSNNPMTDPRTAGYVEGYLKPLNITSMLDAVIRAGEDCLGMLCFEHVGKEHFWEPDEIAFSCQLADQISLAILNQKSKLAEEETRVQSQLKELLMNMATTFINLPLKEVESAIHNSLGELAEVVKADRVTIFYYNFKEHFATATNEWTKPGIQPQFIHLQKIILKKSLHWDIDAHRRGEPIFISDTNSLPKGELRSIFEKAGNKSMLSVPLLNAEECLGFLAIGWIAPHHAFTVDELQIMKVFALMLVNLSKRKNTEESLQKSEEIFRDLVENINDVFFTLNREGTITYISPQISQLYDYAPDELTGHPFSEIVYSEDLDELRSGFMDTLRNNVKPREFRYRDKDGQIRWAQTSSRPIIEKGLVTGVRGLFSDITSRKLAEEELRKLSLAVEQSPAIILITNLAGEIEYVNPRFCQVTGYTLVDVIGRNPSILKSGNTTKEVYQDLWSKISSGKEWRGELYNKKKNGEFYWEAVSISPIINSKGKITHYLAVKEDITDKKEATRRIFDIIIETEERERLRYSHELHDGLGPILSTINLYFQMLAENTETDQKDVIIARASSCIDEGIQTIKEISYNLSPSVLSNFGIVSGIHNFINRLNQTQKLFINFKSNFDRRFEKNLEITIYRIITELLNNTIKYAGASNVEVNLDFNEKSSVLTLDYTDNGRGFDIEKAMSTRKGLGLSNIYQRVDTLNGKINIETGHAKGMKVHIEFQILK